MSFPENRSRRFATRQIDVHGTYSSLPYYNIVQRLLNVITFAFLHDPFSSVISKNRVV